jgi:hypothetical protein
MAIHIEENRPMCGAQVSSSLRCLLEVSASYQLAADQFLIDIYHRYTLGRADKEERRICRLCSRTVIRSMAKN